MSLLRCQFSSTVHYTTSSSCNCTQNIQRAFIINILYTWRWSWTASQSKNHIISLKSVWTIYFLFFLPYSWWFVKREREKLIQKLKILTYIITILFNVHLRVRVNNISIFFLFYSFVSKWWHCSKNKKSFIDISLQCTKCLGKHCYLC